MNGPIHHYHTGELVAQGYWRHIMSQFNWRCFSAVKHIMSQFNWRCFSAVKHIMSQFNWRCFSAVKHIMSQFDWRCFSIVKHIMLQFNWICFSRIKIPIITCEIHRHDFVELTGYFVRQNYDLLKLCRLRPSASRDQRAYCIDFIIPHGCSL